MCTVPHWPAQNEHAKESLHWNSGTDGQIGQVRADLVHLPRPGPGHRDRLRSGAAVRLRGFG